MGEDVRKAIHLVRDLHYSHRKAADATGVTRSVLEKYLKKPDEEIPEVLSQGRFKPVFNEEQEQQIVAYCHDLANRFYAMTRKSLGQLAYNLAVENQLSHPFQNGTAGEEWISSFLIRHQKELSVRTGTPTSLIRITSFTKAVVYRFFDQLESIIQEKNYTAATIFNADETGVSIVPNKAPKRIARTGVRTVPIMTPAERGQLVTVMCCASAQGQFIPPMFVFPNKCKDTDISLSPSGSLYTYSKKGWSTSDTFCVWLKHFRNNATPSKTTPVLLIVDNHGSHISYQAVKFAAKNNIDILTLPPHTTHKLQPLDICFFSPLKSRYAHALTDWQSKNRGLVPRTDIIPWIIKPAYEECCKETTIINGFNKTGIWDKQLGRPNRTVFEDSEFADTVADTSVPNAAADDQVPEVNPPAQDFQGRQYRAATDEREPDGNSSFSRNDAITSLVPYYGSSTDDENDDDAEENFDIISVGIQVDLEDLIHFSEGEVQSATDEIEVLLPSSTHAVGTHVQGINPWDLDKPGTSAQRVEPQRKSRVKGSSELVTSVGHIAKLQEKERQKRKKTSSDSEEAATTRSMSKASKRVLRSESKSGSSSQ
ncbi:unnamed protein product [Allacma fusca]|uniref:DDE-1 domain-containing protein n=1 Tax=Allacma fusca TaxID=39272 RepID=A0A8J2L153_9HEXA|nr:unnamed protein product [Allacma fusca]